MKKLQTIILLLALSTVAFSWTFFEKLGHLKDKTEDIKENLDFNVSDFPHLKDMNIQDMVQSHTPEMKSKLENLKHLIPRGLDLSPHKEVDEFWTGVFDSLKLSKPTELIKCFGTMSGKIFFKKMSTMSDLLFHSKGHDNLALHADYVQLEMLMHALGHTHHCMAKTKDFERLADALQLPHDLESLKKAKYLFFEAKYDKIADEFKGIVDQVDLKNYNKAGKMFGEFMRKSAKIYKQQGEESLAYQAFSNGIAEILSLPLPSQRIDCYSSEDAKHLLSFFRGFSHAVAQGRWYKAEQSVGDFWEKEGKALFEKIPKKAWTCDMNSFETKHINDKLGVDLNSQEFKDKMSNYIKEHNIKFYTYLKSMNSAFEKNDNLHAGSAYGQLLQAIVQSS